MIPDTPVAVLGLGLIGGSVARALAAQGARVLGHDHNLEHVEAAQREGVLHGVLGSALDGIESAEVVLFALPVDATIRMLGLLAPRLRGARLVTDVASTKASIVHAAEAAGLGAVFCGAHPLTGSHRAGWGASRASLFADARVFLCPTSRTTPETLQRAHAFWRALRAGTEVLDAAEHDREMAWRSHLPHIVSNALAVTLHEAGVRRSSLGPGGRDMTRLAGGALSMWAPIVEDNAAEIIVALRACESRLRAFRQALERHDEGTTRRMLDDGCQWFDGDPTAPPRPPA